MSGVAKRHPRITPIPREAVLDLFPGEWVAVKDGKVLAHGPHARDVVLKMRELPAGTTDGAVLQRSARPTEALAIGLG